MRLILLLLFISSFASGQTVHHLRRQSDSSIYFRNTGTVKPGDTIWLSRNLKYVYLDAITGTKEDSVHIWCEPGKTGIGNGATNYCIVVQGRYWVFHGNGVTITPGSVHCNNIFIFGNSADFLIKDATLIGSASAGFFGNPATGGRRANLQFINCTVSKIRGPLTGGRSEGMYLGNTSMMDLKTAWYDSVLIRDCRFFDLDGDGIQLAAAQNCLIENTHVYDFGKAKAAWQNIGILIGGSSSANIKNCVVQDGSGNGLQILGVNKTTVQNTVINNTGAMLNHDGVYIEKKSNEPGPLTVEFINCVINGANRNGLRNVNSTVILNCTEINATGGAKKIGPNIFDTKVPVMEAGAVIYKDKN